MIASNEVGSCTMSDRRKPQKRMRLVLLLLHIFFPTFVLIGLDLLIINFILNLIIAILLIRIDLIILYFFTTILFFLSFFLFFILPNFSVGSFRNLTNLLTEVRSAVSTY